MSDKFPARNNGTHRLMMNAKLSGKDCTDIRNYIKALEFENRKFVDIFNKTNLAQSTQKQ